MKLSNYNLTLAMEDGSKVLYNVLSRKYVVYNESNGSLVENLLLNLNKSEYGLDEIECFKKLIDRNIIIKNEVDELNKIEYNINTAKYQSKALKLVILPTMDCNFNCVYCLQEHEKINMNDAVFDRIVKYIDNAARDLSSLHIRWFGGEPLLEKSRIYAFTEKFKEICKANHCKYEAMIVTNGYLIDDDFIDKVDDLCLKRFQITLDGCESHHNAKRPLANGQGSFERVRDNINKLLEKDVYVTFRINVDEENYSNINDIFDIIPERNRHKVTVFVANLFQTAEKLSLYDIYKASIDKGYAYHNTANTYISCESYGKNSFTIMPDGKTAPCTTAANQGYYYGYINDNGRFIVKNEAIYYNFHNVSTLKNNNCTKCIQLPMCNGGCVLSRFKDNEICNGRVPDGLSAVERAKLHYYSDLKQNLVSKEDII